MRTGICSKCPCLYLLSPGDVTVNATDYIGPGPSRQVSAQPLLHNWQRHRAVPLSQPLNPGSLRHLPRAESLSMSPASLMTFGPCSTPPLLCQGERTGGGLVSLVCESHVCVKSFLFLLTCPLENGAPRTATDWALLGVCVWPSWVRRSRNRGPLKAMSPVE